jgi:hypothetical protein
MSELSDQVLERVQTSGLSDQDKRSAIGMARTWVEKRKPIKRSEISGYEKRDDLAVAIISIMEASAAESKQCIAALKHARAVINRPFRDSTMLGVKAGLELVKPKDGGN